MIGNMILLAIVILMTWLLFRFPLRRAKAPDDYRKLLPFFGFLCIAALLDGVLAYLGTGGLRMASSGAPVTELAEFAEKTGNDGIILVGEVSSRNEVIYQGEYVAYAEEGGHLWSPENLWINLKAGSIAITNATYQAIGWPIDAGGNSYLRVGQRVVIVGFVDNRVDIPDGEKKRAVRADIVYAKSYDDFVLRARVKLVLATAMLFANVVVAILIILFMLPKCVKGMK